MLLRDPLLVDLLAVDAVGEALQMRRAGRAAAPPSGRRPTGSSRRACPWCRPGPSFGKYGLSGLVSRTLTPSTSSSVAGVAISGLQARRRGRSSAARRADRRCSWPDRGRGASARTSPRAGNACRARCFPPSGRRRPRTPSRAAPGSSACRRPSSTGWARRRGRRRRCAAARGRPAARAGPWR